MQLKTIISILVLFSSLNLVFSTSIIQSGMSFELSIITTDNKPDYFTFDELDFSEVYVHTYNETHYFYNFNINDNYPKNYTNLYLRSYRNNANPQTISSYGQIINNQIYIIFEPNYYSLYPYETSYQICDGYNYCNKIEQFKLLNNDSNIETRTSGLDLFLDINQYEEKIDYFTFDELDFSNEYANTYNETHYFYNFNINDNYPKNYTNLYLRIYRNNANPQTISSYGEIIDNQIYMIFEPNYYSLYPYETSYQICDGYNYCNKIEQFKLLNNDSNIETRTSGLDIFFTTIFDLNGIIIPYYIGPTPKNNLKKYNLTQFTINMSDGGNSLTNCFVTINNQNYSMDYNNNICSYTHNITLNETKTKIDFQAFYNQSGIINNLEERTIYSYINENNNKFSAFNISSILISILIIIVGTFL